MHLNKNFLYCTIAFAAGILLVLLPLMLTPEPVMVEELRITESSAAIGAFNESINGQQLYSYSFVLYNGRSQPVNVTLAEPVFTEGISGRILTSDTSINVNKTILPDSSIVVEGEFVFDATGLTKEEIVGLEPFIEHVAIVSTEIVDHP